MTKIIIKQKKKSLFFFVQSGSIFKTQQRVPRLHRRHRTHWKSQRQLTLIYLKKKKRKKSHITESFSRHEKKEEEILNVIRKAETSERSVCWLLSESCRSCRTSLSNNSPSLPDVTTGSQFLMIQLLNYVYFIITGPYSHNNRRSLQLSKLHKTRVFQGVSPRAWHVAALYVKLLIIVLNFNSTEAGDAYEARFRVTFY